MTVKLRQKIERNIVELVVRSAIEAGYELSVDDGEEIPETVQGPCCCYGSDVYNG